MDIREQLERIQAEAAGQMEKIRDKGALEEFRLRVLGKKGELTALLKQMGQLSPEERPKAGQMINAVRAQVTERMEEIERRVRQAEQDARLAKETIDVTEPRKHT